MVHLTAQITANILFSEWNRIFPPADVRLITESECIDLLKDKWEEEYCDSNDKIRCDACPLYGDEDVYIDGDYHTLQMDGEILQYCSDCMYTYMGDNTTPEWYHEQCVQQFIQDVCERLLDKIDNAMSRYPDHYEGPLYLTDYTLAYIRDVALRHGDTGVLALLHPRSPRCTRE